MIYNRTPKAEIIRCVQKDLSYTNELGADLSEILQITHRTNWIRYNHLSNLFAQIVYHGFATVQNLQTLGEEYTGIFQIDNKNVAIPSKPLRLISIILEFGGELLYLKVLRDLKKNIGSNDEILPEAKVKLQKIIDLMEKAIPFVKAFHKGMFYFNKNSTSYHLSKRITGINYVHVRNWLKPDHSLYGYKLLGALTFLQLILILASKLFDLHSNEESKKLHVLDDVSERISHGTPERSAIINKAKCTLCLEGRKNASLTPCGHIFCWECILDWLNEKDECPLCRDKIIKSNVIMLQNMM